MEATGARHGATTQDSTLSPDVNEGNRPLKRAGVNLRALPGW